MDHITQPEFVIRLKWTPGMLTIWDNRRVFHMAMNDYHGHRRHMQRVIVQGASPQ
jgi:taurine dioxygenase